VTVAGNTSANFRARRTLSLTHETEAIVFTEIGSQVERVQGISVGKIVATDEQTLVFAELSGSCKQTAVRSYIVSLLVVGLYRSHGVLLLSLYPVLWIPVLFLQ